MKALPFIKLHNNEVESVYITRSKKRCKLLMSVVNMHKYKEDTRLPKYNVSIKVESTGNIIFTQDGRNFRELMRNARIGALHYINTNGGI